MQILPLPYAIVDLIAYAGLFCYMAGMWCLILQIATYVLLQEPDVVRIPISILAGFIVLPLIIYVIPRSKPDNGQARDSGFFDANASSDHLNADARHYTK